MSPMSVAMAAMAENTLISWVTPETPKSTPTAHLESFFAETCRAPPSVSLVTKLLLSPAQ